jgi:hypothetical protein
MQKDCFVGASPDDDETPLSQDDVPSPSEIFSIPYLDRQLGFEGAAHQVDAKVDRSQLASYVSVYHGRRVTPPPWAAQAEADADARYAANKHLYPWDRDHIERPRLRALAVYAVATLRARMSTLLSRAEL